MLDIKFIRENVDVVKAGAKKKHIDIDLDRLLKVDDERRKLMGEVEGMRAKQNEVSKAVAAGGPERDQLIADMKVLKAEMEAKEAELEPLIKEWELLMVQVPNVPDISVPDGDSDADNQEAKTWGTLPTFDFPLKSHIEIMEGKRMADFERGAKVAGFRGYYLKGDGALLSFAVWQYAQRFFMGKDFVPMIVPSLVRRVTMLGTGYIPQGEEDLYRTQDNEYLAGTGEVGAMAYYMGEILDKKDLPTKFLAFSPCFRREAGSHSKDVKGLIRVHEFFKWEQVVLCEANHEESVRQHEWVNRNTEEFIESLNIPYRTVVNCGGDLGLGQVKKYDIELWVPAEKKYREISSASYFHDFQTRRLGIRYRDDDGTVRFAHSLNSTAIPTPRILVSIIENYQQADGTVKVPAALVPFVGKEVLG